MMNKQSKDEITAALQNLARAGGKVNYIWFNFTALFNSQLLF